MKKPAGPPGQNFRIGKTKKNLNFLRAQLTSAGGAATSTATLASIYNPYKAVQGSDGFRRAAPVKDTKTLRQPTAYPRIDSGFQTFQDIYSQKFGMGKAPLQ